MIEAHKPNWPALDRAAYLIERASVPQYIPTYCAEAGQLFAMLAKAARQNTPPEGGSHTH